MKKENTYHITFDDLIILASMKCEYQYVQLMADSCDKSTILKQDYCNSCRARLIAEKILEHK